MALLKKLCPSWTAENVKMSIRLMVQLWDNGDPDLTGSKLLVMLCLADHSNDDGVCWPSITRLASRTRIDKRNVIRHLHALEDAGYLKIHRTPGRSNRYTISGTRGDITTSDEITTSGKTITPTSDDITTPPVAILPPKSSYNPNLEPSKELPKQKKPSPKKDSHVHSQQQEMFGAVAEVCKVDPKLKASLIGKNATALLNAGYTPSQVLRFPVWWRANWHGKDGKIATMGQLLEFIKQAVGPGENAEPKNGTDPVKPKTVPIKDPVTGEIREVPA